MKRFVVLRTCSLIALLSLAFIASCQTAPAPEAPQTLPSVPEAPQTLPSVPAEETVEKQTITERTCHVKMDEGPQATYLYREFIQDPLGMAYGPDGYIYVADFSGRHIVRISPDDEMDDLGIWESGFFNYGGPTDVDFDSSGNLYFCAHSDIYYIGDDNNIHEVPNVQHGGPVEAIAFSPSDELYYIDRADSTQRDGIGQGKVLKIDSDGDSVVVTDGLIWPRSLIFGLDGALYVSVGSEEGVSIIVEVDLQTGEVNEFFTADRLYEIGGLAVDSDGDIWARALWNAYQVSPDGNVKQYFIDDKDSSEYDFQSPGGICVNDKGEIYIGAASSSPIWKLIPFTTDKDNNKYTLAVVSEGFWADDLDVGPDGKVYVHNNYSDEIICFNPDGEKEVLLDCAKEDIPVVQYGLAVDSEGNIFIATHKGEIKVLQPDGNLSHYASVGVSQIKCGIDDNLYAVTRGENPEIIRISDVDTYDTFISKIEGFPFEPSHTVQLAPAPDGGLYVYSVTARELYYATPEGEVELFLDLSQAELGGSEPYLVAASPSGEIYISSQVMYRIDHNKRIHPHAHGIADAAPIDTSPDGEWLYIPQPGAIVRIPT